MNKRPLNLTANRTQYSSCHVNLSGSGIYFGSPFGYYPTFHILTSVGRKQYFQYVKRMFPLFRAVVKFFLYTPPRSKVLRHAPDNKTFFNPWLQLRPWLHESFTIGLRFQLAYSSWCFSSSFWSKAFKIALPVICSPGLKLSIGLFWAHASNMLGQMKYLVRAMLCWVLWSTSYVPNWPYFTMHSTALRGFEFYSHFTLLCSTISSFCQVPCMSSQNHKIEIVMRIMYMIE